jgi:hypothetical protein
MRNAAFALFAVLSAHVTPAAATPTEVVVRVISQDAKFVGDSMGGAEVVLRDARSGEILAQGVTRGGTGDTNLIMASSGRSPQRSSATAAAFHALLDIDRPTLVRVEINGPLGFPRTMQRASSERWLVPGQSGGTGEGWVVELPGLAIRLSAGTPTQFRRGTAQSLTAEVQLMCGCPITPGGLWDAAQYEVFAELWQSGAVRERLSFAFSESPGRFLANWTPMVRGDADLVIVARNRVTGNTGVLEQPVTIR